MDIWDSFQRKMKTRLQIANEAKVEIPKKRRTSTHCKPINLVMSEPKQLQLQVEGLSNLMATLKEHEGKRRTVMFIGSMNESGESWCPDCREGLYLFDHVKFPVRIVTSRSFNIHESCSKTGCCSTIH